MIPAAIPIELEPLPETHASDCEAWEYGMCSCGRQRPLSADETPEGEGD